MPLYLMCSLINCNMMTSCKGGRCCASFISTQPLLSTQQGGNTWFKTHGVPAGWPVSSAEMNDSLLRQSEFMVRGIDYLPDSVKRRQLQKKYLPKFLRVDPHTWSVSYMHFLSHRGKTDNTIISVTPGCSRSGSQSTLRGLSPVWSYDDDVFSARRQSHTSTPDTISITDEAASDWRTYEHFSFENLVMSGGGSKGYAYIGALKVSWNLYSCYKYPV
jgi:hypothetical protein